jgi:hypothetical protein
MLVISARLTLLPANLAQQRPFPTFLSPAHGGRQRGSYPFPRRKHESRALYSRSTPFGALRLEILHSLLCPACTLGKTSFARVATQPGASRLRFLNSLSTVSQQAPTCLRNRLQLGRCSARIARCSVRGCRARATRLGRCTDGQGRPLRQRELCGRHANRLKANRPNLHELGAFLTGRAARTVSQELDASGFRVQDLCMIGATVVISRAQLRTSHDTVVGFLRGAGCAIGRVHVRLSDASGVAIEEKAGSTKAPTQQSLPQRSPITLPAARACGLTWKRSLPLRDRAIRAAGSLSERARNPSNAGKNSQTPAAGL